MIKTTSISKLYQTKHGAVHALRDVSMAIHKGEFVTVRGPSGSGKTTLLFALGGMLRPSQGSVTIGETDLYSMNQSGRAKFRAENIGFVFQMFHLVGYLNVLENVLLPLGTGGAKVAPNRAKEILEKMGLGDRLTHRPSELSAGERQRTAIARALLRNPSVILADEPTGNLDPDNAAQILSSLADYRDQGGSVVLVTHGHLGDNYANRTIYLRDGCISDE
ncbi:MAG: ABC transporter ATP-binding protein [Candidatus Hinthialibacter antarcticus]|nr:ABC transporter ATP-binding protein [Candidatus Hinthialibacter antarcticus]